MNWGSVKKEFKIGDKVVLNSGGPVMTVRGIVRNTWYDCGWFDANGTFGEAQFRGECITLASELCNRCDDGVAINENFRTKEPCRHCQG